ncbi:MULTISPECIES: SlyX family protein [unclassified Paracoccus (in: a-proteobacteria)]|uniref:SlyX family protein n=1 Tax=unclassified Paracoccus (in: a-proteobacteria) TaxID=2688777 RepID=UPI0015FEB9E1|nr:MULTISPECIES: SlyX family protein [unclassified Paracoccus (in: a-proteobacteria)]MBB1491810.1 SlyX family protein [Paracoccus sp. MC1854]MBB1496906.1 SlyX family protein [Paracoccus sp. MC1862]QQO45528.1 SlyX family protein [Paracoccus sp. MC1862]
MDKLQALEERIAHLQRSVEDLSDVVTRQAAEIARLSRHVGLLMEREAGREADEGTIPLADQRPPHW